MQESQFEKFLMGDDSIKSKEKAVNTRMSKARAVEKCLGQSLDVIVRDDEEMLHALLVINEKLNNYNGAYSNALRKYYIFKNGKAFPQIKSYERFGN